MHSGLKKGKKKFFKVYHAKLYKFMQISHSVGLIVAS